MPDNTKLDMEVFETEIPFGRNRLLKGLGAVLFGSVISAFGAARSDASCSGGGPQCEGRVGACTHNTPWMNECSGCYQGACSGCTPSHANYNYCPGDGSMWCTCYNGQLWGCYDWSQTVAGGTDTCYCKWNWGTPC